MIKLKSLIYLLLLSTSMAFGVERSYDDLKNVALNFMNDTHNKVNYEIKKEIVITQNSTHRIFLLKPSGWIIISKDDIARPILAYSEISNLEENNLSPEFKKWLEGLNKEVQTAKQNNSLRTLVNTNKKNKFKNQWKKYSVEKDIFDENKLYNSSLRTGTIVYESRDFLLKNINWDQGYPYNAITPNNNYVGCTATALTQIMAFHRWPQRGLGSYSYKHSEYGTINANFNIMYNWRTPTATDKALISYHVGVASDMHYASSGSAAWPIEENLRKHFGYDLQNRVERANYTEDEWAQKIKTDINNKRPIWYAGFSSSDGHAIVLDGYREGETNFYHFNYGWNGAYNGWYALDAMGVGFNNNQAALFEMKPNLSNTFRFQDDRVYLYNPSTKRLAFSRGAPVKRNEGGWLRSPIALGTDINYYSKAVWQIQPYADGYVIRNVKTKRYLFDPSGRNDPREFGWLGSTKILETDMNYYGKAVWYLERNSYTKNTFKIKNAISGKYLFQTGSKVKGYEGGWLKSPSLVGLNSPSNYYNRATWEIK